MGSVITSDRTKLEVHGSEPVFGAQTEILMDLKLDADETPRPEFYLEDFVLTSEVERLLSTLESIGDGVVDHLEVRGGIPRRILLKVNPVERG